MVIIVEYQSDSKPGLSFHYCVVSLDKRLCSTLSLFIPKVYKMDTGNILLGVTLCLWGSSNTPVYFIKQVKMDQFKH